MCIGMCEREEREREQMKSNKKIIIEFVWESLIGSMQWTIEQINSTPLTANKFCHRHHLM